MPFRFDNITRTDLAINYSFFIPIGAGAFCRYAKSCVDDNSYPSPSPCPFPTESANLELVSDDNSE
jgi:hypothetical protein